MRGEPLSQDHWSDLFRMLGIPKGMTLERLTFSDILAVADAIVAHATELKVSYSALNFFILVYKCHHKMVTVVFDQ